MNNKTRNLFLVCLIGTLLGQVLGISLPKGRVLGVNQKLRINDLVATIKQLEEQDNKVNAIAERVRQFSTMIEDRKFMLNLFVKKLEVDARKAHAIHRGDQIDKLVEKLNNNKSEIKLI